MKSIIVYSGKGGVGKTTTSANIAKTLAKQKKKVYIIDADINTPSMGVIFGDKHPDKNIWVGSTSFLYKNLIYMERAMVRKFLRTCIDEIKEIQPDYVIVDTPPSITDVHINLLEVIKASAVAIVTQPNELSRTDVNRTALFFTERCKEAGVIIIENMCKDEAAYDYSWKCVERIPFVEGFDGNKAFTMFEDKYNNIVKELEEMNIESVRLEAQRKVLFDESITADELPYFDHDAPHRFGQSPREIKFINCSTWDEIRERLQDCNDYCGMIGNDRFLDECTSERVKRLVDCFEQDDEAYFMITNCPNTEIPLIVGEIGKASFFIADSYYGVPRIKYQTRNGDVVLFPYEVKPATEKDIEIALQDGSTITSDGRYIPAKEVLEQIYYAFGSRVGLLSNWEETYEKILGSARRPNEHLKSVESPIKTKAKERQQFKKEYNERK